MRARLRLPTAAGLARSAHHPSEEHRGPAETIGSEDGRRPWKKGLFANWGASSEMRGGNDWGVSRLSIGNGGVRWTVAEVLSTH